MLIHCIFKARSIHLRHGVCYSTCCRWILLDQDERKKSDAGRSAVCTYCTTFGLLRRAALYVVDSADDCRQGRRAQRTVVWRCVCGSRQISLLVVIRLMFVSITLAKVTRLKWSHVRSALLKNAKRSKTFVG